MNRNYIILAILFLILASGLLLLPERENYKQISPGELMRDVVQNTRYLTTDQVAQMIIEGDPILELVDVRNEGDYFEYSLPRAINVPLDSILAEDYTGYFGIEDMNVVFFSNDDIKADQAWVIAKRMGYKSIYVMKGGLNCWIKTIIQPQSPAETASKEEFELYDFRKGATMYFTGAEISAPTSDGEQAVAVKRKKKSSVAEGGC
jgi:3-mercaptopyruvate sulfurtransferase SseA